MIEEQLKAVMAKVFNVPVSEISEESNNESIEKWDSLGHMNLCLALEQEFGVELDVDRVASMQSYADVLAVIAQAVGR